jgi:hypothetical protein
MAAKLARLTHKIAIQLHLVAESCTICSSRSRRPVRKLLDTPSYNRDDVSHLKYIVPTTQTWGTHGDEDSGRNVFLGCDTV